MKLLDVNVLLAAHRDDHPHFELGRGWLERVVGARSPFAVTDLVAGSFLRVATNRRIFSIPTPVDNAFDYLRSLRGQPAHVDVKPGPDHLGVLERVCHDADIAGDLVPDAQLAAIAIEYDCELVSFDRDFARFADLRWTIPK